MIIKKDGKQYYINVSEMQKNNEYFIVKKNSEMFYKIINNFPYINLIIENDNLIDVEVDEQKKNKKTHLESIKEEIEQLKQNLSNTDYQAIKYAEGQISEEEYQPIKAQRQAWRNSINELEARLGLEAQNNV